MSLDLFQIADRIARSNIGTVANETLDNYSTLLDDKLASPLNVTISGTTITVSASTIQKLVSNGSDGTQNSYKWRIPPISSTDVLTTTSTVETASGNTTGSFKYASDPGTTVAANYFVQMGIEVHSDGYLYIVWGTPASSLGATTIPAFTTSNAFAIAVVKLQKNSSTGTWGFTTPVASSIEIIKGAGGGGSGTSGIQGVTGIIGATGIQGIQGTTGILGINGITGIQGIQGNTGLMGPTGIQGVTGIIANTYDPGEIVDTLYQARLYDNFQLSPTTSGVTPVNINTGYTNATFITSGPSFRLSYDASWTVTGTGTSMTMSGTPAYTVAVGDILIVNGYARKITVVSSQTSYTIEAAFPTNPSTSACCVSQCVYTYDLNNFTSNSTGLAVSSQLSSSISQVLVSYADSATGTYIPNYSTTPGIAYVVSADGSNYSSTNVRTTTLASESYEVATPTSGTNFYVRFFSNASSGANSVNLLSYKALWQKQVQGTGVGTPTLVAFARPNAGLYVNCSYSVVAGKGRFTFTTPYAAGLSATNPAGSALEVFGNGQLFPLLVAGVTDTTQGYFQEINSTTIQLDQDYSLTPYEFLMKTPSTVIDSNTYNTSNIAAHQTVLTNTSLSTVVRTQIAVPYTTITGRATIPNLNSDISTKGGVDRILVQDIYNIQTETGPNSESVYGVRGDRDGLMRFIGMWSSVQNTSGEYITNALINTTDAIEISFYGTGLNILTNGSGALNLIPSIDGGSEGSNIFGGVTFSSILSARNYGQNRVTTAVSGLTLGLHTLRLRLNAAVDPGIAGFEVINLETAAVCIPGTYCYQGTVYTNSGSVSTLPFQPAAYTAGAYTTGACVLNYVNSSGVIGQVFTPAPKKLSEGGPGPSYVSGANHTNEQMIRQYNWREFGASRNPGAPDDFSLLVGGAAQNVAFTLDDGTTTLIGYQVSTSNGNLSISNSGSTLAFTFVGTGLDITWCGDSTGTNSSASAFTVAIDGGTPNNWTTVCTTTTTATAVVGKVVSGLPYGTHTVQFVRNTVNVWDLSVVAFRVYAPAVPTLPANSAPIGQYYVLANYIANSTAGILTIGQGLLRKQLSQRESVYVGTWSESAVNPPNYIGGWETSSNTSSNYITYTFYGVGFELRGQSNTGYSSNISVLLQNLSTGGSLLAATVSNFPTLVSSVYGGYSFSAGTLNQSVSNTNGSGLSISGLPLGEYTVKFLLNSSAYLIVEAFDIICPIYFPKIQTDGMRQLTLSVGSCSLGDLRQNWLQDTARNKVRAVAFGINSSPSTTSTSFVPCPDLSLAISSLNSPGGDFLLSFAISINYNSASDNILAALYVDGIIISPILATSTSTTLNTQVQVTGTLPVYLSQGAHVVAVYWQSDSNPMIASSIRRYLMAIEL